MCKCVQGYHILGARGNTRVWMCAEREQMGSNRKAAQLSGTYMSCKGACILFGKARVLTVHLAKCQCIMCFKNWQKTPKNVVTK
jgi:hypothetical protein